MENKNETAVAIGAAPKQASGQGALLNFVDRAMREGIMNALPCVRAKRLGRLKNERAIRDEKLLKKTLGNIRDSAINEKLKEASTEKKYIKTTPDGRTFEYSYNTWLDATAGDIDCTKKHAKFIINEPVEVIPPGGGVSCYRLTFRRTEYEVGIDGIANKIGWPYISGPHFVDGFMRWDGL